MIGGHPVEALLRPPAELTAGAVSVLCGAAAALGPEYVMMTPGVGHATAAVLGASGCWWFARGLRIVRYQRNLRRRRRFSMRAARIPVDADRLYVMEHGRVVQSGRYDDLLTREGPFAELAKRQMH